VNKKIPVEAFSFYFGLGTGRSYEAVAEKYSVSKRGVVAHAQRDKWQERIAQLEQQARERADEQAAESLDAMNRRHLQEARFLQSRGLEGLKSGRFELYGAAGRLVEQGVNLERLIRGQATERTETMATVARRECDRWLVRDGEATSGGDELDPSNDESSFDTERDSDDLDPPEGDDED